jgi:hypothetical protein
MIVVSTMSSETRMKEEMSSFISALMLGHFKLDAIAHPIVGISCSQLLQKVG